MEQQLLDQLVDAYTPAEIGIWPLAPGWWIVIALTLGTLFFLVLYSVKKYKCNLWKRQALKTLADIEERYLNAPNEKDLIATMQLIKTTLSAHAENTQPLTAIGNELNEIVRNASAKHSISSELKLIQACIYQPRSHQPTVHQTQNSSSENANLNADNFSSIRTWIKGL